MSDQYRQSFQADANEIGPLIFYEDFMTGSDGKGYLPNCQLDFNLDPLNVVIKSHLIAIEPYTKLIGVPRSRTVYKTALLFIGISIHFGTKRL